MTVWFLGSFGKTVAPQTQTNPKLYACNSAANSAQGWMLSLLFALKMCVCKFVSHCLCHCIMLLLQSALICTCPSSQQSEQSPKDMSHPCAPIKDSTRDNTAAFLTQRSKNEVRPLTPPYLQPVHWIQAVAPLAACFHSFFCFNSGQQLQCTLSLV